MKNVMLNLPKEQLDILNEASIILKKEIERIKNTNIEENRLAKFQGSQILKPLNDYYNDLKVAELFDDIFETNFVTTIVHSNPTNSFITQQLVSNDQTAEKILSPRRMGGGFPLRGDGRMMGMHPNMQNRMGPPNHNHQHIHTNNSPCDCEDHK